MSKQNKHNNQGNDLTLLPDFNIPAWDTLDLNWDLPEIKWDFSEITWDLPEIKWDFADIKWAEDLPTREDLCKDLPTWEDMFKDLPDPGETNWISL